MASPELHLPGSAVALLCGQLAPRSAGGDDPSFPDGPGFHIVLDHCFPQKPLPTPVAAADGAVCRSKPPSMFFLCGSLCVVAQKSIFYVARQIPLHYSESICPLWFSPFPGCTRLGVLSSESRQKRLVLTQP